jgi:hypothetical protein
LGAPPTLTTWAFNGGVDATSMAAAASLGAQQVAVPESDLSALPSQDQGLTFGWPTKLDVPGTEVEVIGADTELSARMTEAAAPGQAVLVANQVLAELAMIDLERPSDVRGVVLLPPAGTVVDPTFLSVLLAGLRGDPLVRAATLADEFGTVPLGSSGANKPLVRRLDGPRSAAGLTGSGQLSEAFGALEEDGNVFGNSSLVSALGQQLTVSLSSVWSASQRSTMISGIVKAARAELAKIRLPPSISITLTSRQGKLPLTILSASSTPAHVRLVLSSQELSFVAQRFSEGVCVPLNPENESCELTLTHPTTVVQVNVVVRAPGAFQLSLTLETPSGVTMVAGADTVRSTAISEVGLALMIGAALFLAVWWARNARHGRRAKKLVPRPPDEDSLPDEGPLADAGPLAGEGPLPDEGPWEGPTTVVDIPVPGRGVAAPAHRSPVAPPAVGKAGRLLGPAGGPPV